MGGSQGADPAYRFQFVAAPDDLAPYVNSLYSWRLSGERLDDVLPAYSGQLVVFAEGEGRMQFAGNRTGVTSDAFFLAPLQSAHGFEVRGPATCFGVSLNFRGWAALTGLPVDEWNNRMFAPAHCLAPHLTERLAALVPQWRAGRLDDDGVLAAMTQIVREGLDELPDRHLQVIDRTLEWLSSSFKPDLAALYSALPYSERHVQRLVARFFGLSPVRLVRRYRAVRAATILSLPSLPAALEAEIRSAFYDQAHMIREIRHFTGRTPRLLLPQDEAGLNTMLGPDGYSAVDLFGGNEGIQLGRDA